MPKGPVGTTLKDVLSFDPFNFSERENEYLSRLIEQTGPYTFRAKEASIPFDTLSETDKEALDFVIEHFGHMTSMQLSDYTHKYPEWYRYKDLFDSGLTKRERIETYELLSTIKDDPLGVSEEHIKETEKIIAGLFE